MKIVIFCLTVFSLLLLTGCVEEFPEPEPVDNTPEFRLQDIIVHYISTNEDYTTYELENPNNYTVTARVETVCYDDNDQALPVGNIDAIPFKPLERKPFVTDCPTISEWAELEVSFVE